MHLGQGWQFFAPDDLITRLTGVLEAEPQVFQVGVNFADATELTGACAAENVVRRSLRAGRYLLTDAVARGPAMFDTDCLDRVGDVNHNESDQLDVIARMALAAGLQTASLDEVLCVAAV